MTEPGVRLSPRPPEPAVRPRAFEPGLSPRVALPYPFRAANPS